MATSSGSMIQPMPPFDPDNEIGTNLAPKWKIWIEDFQMYLVATGITDKKRQRALLLYQAGARVREIFRQLPDTGDDLETAVAKLNEYFEPQKHRLYEVYKFRQAAQENNESIDQYHTRLRSLAERCQFENMDFDITLQIVLKGSSSRLRKQALRDPKMTLKDLLIAGRQIEMSNFQVADIEQKQFERQELHALRKNTRQQPSKGTCRNCGGEWPHEKGNCPARGKECRKCGKLNHFARQCRSSKPDNEVPNQYPESNRRGNKIRPVVGPPDNQSESSSSDESSYCYAVKTTAKNNPTTKVTINKHQVKFTVDTGSTINVIDQSTFKQLGPITLRKTRIKAYPFNGTVPVKMKGKFQTTVESRKKITVATIYVTEADGGCLLSANTAEDLGLITLHLNHIKVTKPNSQAAQQVNIPDKGVQRIVNKHSSVFQGQGKLRNKQIELIIDEAVKPVAQKQRRIPFHLREKVERELSKLEHDDIIEPVPDTEETEWISPLVIVPKKDDKIRLCVDMRAANNAIKRVRHPIPTVKDVSLELNGAKFFTKLDLTQAYHQLELSPSSRHITTFVTHTGIYRFKRLNYGTNSAAEIFQHTLQQVLQGIKGVRNIADDILIFGSTYEEHNTSLEECLQRLEDNGLTLNVGKCLFLKQNLDFFGLVFSKDGVSPDPKQISALANSTTPTTPSEVRIAYLGWQTLVLNLYLILPPSQNHFVCLPTKTFHLHGGTNKRMHTKP